jgi:glutathione synthase/RimK-type ligase-like ATP-grasp enzyme
MAASGGQGHSLNPEITRAITQSIVPPNLAVPNLAAQAGAAPQSVASGSVPISEAIEALLSSAAQLLHAGEFAAARDQYNQALLANLCAQRAHAGLYYACAGLGDERTAALHLSKALQLQAIVALPYRGPQAGANLRPGAGAPVSILLLQSIHAGNVLIQRLLDDRIFRTHVLVVEFYEPWMPLPPHQVVLNAIGDADIRADALEAAVAVLARTEAPVINPPEAVLATGRCHNARRLDDIPGVRTPITVSLSRSALESDKAASILASHGLRFPLLLRSPGYHMGLHFVRVERAADLPAALTELPQQGFAGNEVLAIEYLDSRASDGLSRKYRVLFVDGRPYPVHLAVSDHWKVHFFASRMGEHPERRAEDARFLRDMPAVLGPDIMKALARICDKLRLDYGGIDFGISRSGELLLYEANANMSVIRPDQDPMWDYRRAAIDAIHGAVHRMLTNRALMHLAGGEMQMHAQA